jgi:hypothetical protein
MNQFIIRRQGAEKLEGHHLGDEGRASCLGSPSRRGNLAWKTTSELRSEDQNRGRAPVVILFM